MNAMEFWTMVVAIAAILAALYSIWRNGNKSRDKFTKVEAGLKVITDSVNHKDYGLQAQGQKLNDHLINCGKISTGLTERVNHLEEAVPKKRKK